jgi:putative Holliday junction resolvase
MSEATMCRTLLGFDFGQKRIGIAVGQLLTRSATPVATLTSRGGKPDWNAVGRLIAEWKPDALVVGIPVHMDGSIQPTTKAAQRFCRQLQGRYGLPVYPAEERLSSYLVESGGADTRTNIDALAAQVILQDWLQQQESES